MRYGPYTSQRCPSSGCSDFACLNRVGSAHRWCAIVSKKNTSLRRGTGRVRIHSGYATVMPCGLCFAGYSSLSPSGIVHPIHDFPHLVRLVRHRGASRPHVSQWLAASPYLFQPHEHPGTFCNRKQLPRVSLVFLVHRMNVSPWRRPFIQSPGSYCFCSALSYKLLLSLTTQPAASRRCLQHSQRGMSPIHVRSRTETT